MSEITSFSLYTEQIVNNSSEKENSIDKKGLKYS